MGMSMWVESFKVKDASLSLAVVAYVMLGKDMFATI